MPISLIFPFLFKSSLVALTAPHHNPVISPPFGFGLPFLMVFFYFPPFWEYFISAIHE